LCCKTILKIVLSAGDDLQNRHTPNNKENQNLDKVHER